jgi:hypothetical protein
MHPRSLIISCHFSGESIGLGITCKNWCKSVRSIADSNLSTVDKFTCLCSWFLILLIFLSLRPVWCARYGIAWKLWIPPFHSRICNSYGCSALCRVIQSVKKGANSSVRTTNGSWGTRPNFSSRSYPVWLWVFIRRHSDLDVTLSTCEMPVTFVVRPFVLFTPIVRR